VLIYLLIIYLLVVSYIRDTKDARLKGWLPFKCIRENFKEAEVSEVEPKRL